MDPATWFGTVFEGETLLWDEVKGLGAYDQDANKVNLWLPLEALSRQYADFSGSSKVTIQFFYFKLNNLDVVDSYPPIETVFESLAAIAANTLAINFTATTQRTSFPYGENDSACRYTTEISYSGAISFTSTGSPLLSHWSALKPQFLGSLSKQELPNNIDHNGAAYPCSGYDNLPYETNGNGFHTRSDSAGLTANDLLRLFTPVYNQWLYGNSSIFVPSEARENPKTFVQSYAYNPLTKTATVRGTASCNGITNCSSADMADVFDWKLTIKVPQ
jgi:hypothetical protein